MKPVYNKKAIYYNATYTSGNGADARTFRFQIGQYLRNLNATIYDIKPHHSRDKEGNITIERFIIYIYSHQSNEIIPYREFKNYDELSFNINYLTDED